MRSEDEVLAILLADIHLSLKPPLWRSAEEDWLEVQAKVLCEVDWLQEKYGCPVICAGDIFDRSRKIADGWNASAELINFAIKYLPDNMYAIPGQHDLPNHQYIDIDRSAYWTLVKAGKIKNIPPIPQEHYDITIIDKRLALFGFPPGYEILPNEVNNESCILDIAVIHDYVWIPGHSYPDAPKEKRLGQTSFDKKWLGYDVLVYGDNHKGFTHKIGTSTVFNCGTLMRRKSDEIDYRPQVGLLLADGSVVPHYLDISQDKYLDTVDLAEKERSNLDMTEFFNELEKLGKTALDFKEAMKEYFAGGKTSSEAKQIILEAMEK